mgnify:CR=1 FL=1
MTWSIWVIVLLWLSASPASAGTRTITVKGTVDDSTGTVTVNGTTAMVSNGAFSVEVTLSEGNNTIMATAMDAAGNTATTSVTVALDTAPPVITIISPTDGQVLGAK